jgi:hypothetical protein
MTRITIFMPLRHQRTPSELLPSALRLGALMPGAGHLVHMPWHIFLRTGDYEASAAANVIAAAVDKRYIERSGAKGIYPLMYYSHNLHFVGWPKNTMKLGGRLLCP